jgi:hypothetical protein
MGGRSWLILAIPIIAAVCLAGCNGTSTSPNSSSSGMVPVSMTIHDTPPSGVSILSFEIHITGAALQPSDSTASAVSLISAPDEIELEHLQTSSAFLGSSSVPAGTYNSLTVTFANPQMTIQNNTAAAITVGGQTCNVGQICEVKPTLNQASVTVNANPPFPITLSATAPVNLGMDFNLNSSIGSDLSITPTVTVTSATSSAGKSGDQEDIELVGSVTGVDSSNQSFTLQIPLSGQTDTIMTTSTTEFGFENDNCSANNFSCLATGQTVKVEAQMNNGALTAKDVEGIALPKTQTVMGTVVSLDATQNQFQLVLQDIEDSQDAQTLTLGLPVMVTVQSGATFDVNAGGLSLGGLNFSSFSNLLLGQEISVAVSGVQSSTSGIALTTNHVTLDMSEISGTVASVDASGNTLTLTNLPSLFTSNGITQILVQVGSSTQYENTTGLGALSTNQTVSVGGLLLPNPSSTTEPILLASAVKLRLD